MSEPLCQCGHRFHWPATGYCHECGNTENGCHAYAPPARSRDDAEKAIAAVLGLSDDALARRALWREAAEAGIESGVDWPRIALTLFSDIDRLADHYRRAVTQCAAAVRARAAELSGGSDPEQQQQ